MKAYKGFKLNEQGQLTCRKFIYEVGKTYTTDRAVICKSGFHACLLPCDVFNYYNSYNGEVEYHEVEIDGIVGGWTSDSKVSGKKITIGKKVSIDEIIKLSIQMMLDKKEIYFREEFARIRKDVKYNYINKEGKFISEQWFDSCWPFRNGFAVVSLNSKLYKINTKGEVIN